MRSFWRRQHCSTTIDPYSSCSLPSYANFCCSTIHPEHALEPPTTIQAPALAGSASVSFKSSRYDEMLLLRSCLLRKLPASVLPQSSVSIQSTFPSMASMPAMAPLVPNRSASLITAKRIMRGSSVSERHMVACVAAEESNRMMK